MRTAIHCLLYFTYLLILFMSYIFSKVSKSKYFVLFVIFKDFLHTTRSFSKVSGGEWFVLMLNFMSLVFISLSDFVSCFVLSCSDLGFSCYSASSRGANYCDKCACLFVCLSICSWILKIHVLTSWNFLHMLTMAVAQSSDDSAICYICLWMSLWFT